MRDEDKASKLKMKTIKENHKEKEENNRLTSHKKPISSHPGRSFIYTKGGNTINIGNSHKLRKGAFVTRTKRTLTTEENI